jgi:hypothetical protein
MTRRRRDTWFEINYGTPRVTWRPVHPDGWRALWIFVGGLTGMLVLGMILPLVGANPGWSLAVAAGCVAVGGWFLWSIRGRVRY